MNLKDEDLRRLYRSYISTRVPENRKGCPSLETLVLFFELGTAASIKLEIVDHLTACLACTQDFEFLLRLQKYQDQIIRQSQRIRLAEFPDVSSLTSLHGFGFLWKFSSVAIGIVLVISSLIVIVQNWQRLDGIRATTSHVTLIQPDQNNPATFPFVFKWENVRGAENYVLEIYDETLLPIWKSPEIISPNLRLPEDISRGLRLNKPYYWMIIAYRDNKILAESELVRFMITPRNH